MKFTKNQINFALVAVASVLVTGALIYLTPLKHWTPISPAMKEVDPKEFYADYSAHPDKYILIDVRSAAIYQSAHAKGAISIPVENLYDDHYSLPRTGKTIALICTTGRLAAIAYGYLENWGFTNLVHIDGGMVNWVSEGLPVEGKNIAASLAPDEHQ